jgi:hypothetical protein
MTKLIVSLMFLVGSLASAANCPKITNNSSQELTNNCKNSVQLARSCQKVGDELYNYRLATSAKVQCHMDFMKLGAANSASESPKFRHSLSKYIDLNSKCHQKAKSDLDRQFCIARAAESVVSTFNEIN